MIKGYKITIMKMQQIRTTCTNNPVFFDEGMIELEGIIENMYKGQKLKW